MPLEAAIKVVHFPKNKCLRLRLKKKKHKNSAFSSPDFIIV